MSTDKVLNLLSNNYHELVSKVLINMDNIDVINSYKLIHQDLLKLNNKIEDLIGDIDRQQLSLTDFEKQRLNNLEHMDEVIQKALPIITLISFSTDLSSKL